MKQSAARFFENKPQTTVFFKRDQLAGNSFSMYKHFSTPEDLEDVIYLSNAP